MNSQFTRQKDILFSAIYSLYHSPFSLLPLPHWIGNISSKSIHLFDGHVLFLKRTSTVLEMKRWILDLVIPGRMEVKNNSGPLWAQMWIEKGTPSSRMQPERGLSWQVQPGGISAPSPLHQLPLYRTWPVWLWGRPWLDFQYGLSMNQNLDEDHKKYCMPPYQSPLCWEIFEKVHHSKISFRHKQWLQSLTGGRKTMFQLYPWNWADSRKASCVVLVSAHNKIAPSEALG